MGPGTTEAEFIVAHTMEEAIAAVSACERVFVIGGPSVYDTFRELITSVHVTYVKGDHFDCTIYYDVDRLLGSRNRCVRSEKAESNGYTYRFADYVLRAPDA
jgi:dihydrofolate reductase